MDQMGAIILAAGPSSRFGGIKQLLQYHNKTLIGHAISVAKEVAKTVVVVVGAHAEKIEKEITDTDVVCVFNNGWQEGMGSSIRSGISFLLQIHPDAEAAIIM